MQEEPQENTGPQVEIPEPAPPLPEEAPGPEIEAPPEEVQIPELEPEGPPVIDKVDIDELDGPALPMSVAPVSDKPAHLVVQPCGLWQALMDPKELTQYELDHGVTWKERRDIQSDVSPKERQLYELYSQVLKKKRVTILHFVAAYRLSQAGFELWPRKEKNLKDMKVL